MPGLDRGAPDAGRSQPPLPLAHTRPAESVVIPEGEFLMGTSDEQVLLLLSKEDWAREWDDRNLFAMEQPQHRVSLPAFAIHLRPVSNAEYWQFVWKTGYRAPRSWSGFRPPDGMDPHPVVEVSYLDALAYCRWRAEQTGLPYRLPSEAEWERAARGTDARMYPWGGDFEVWRCNTVESGKRGTTPVGSYSPGGDSPSGVTDMAGNVWEWTSSLLKPYPYAAGDGREDPEAPGLRVVRGGAWYYSRKLARCAAREGLVPGNVSPALGFRMAYSLSR